MKADEEWVDPKSMVPCCAKTKDDHGRYCIGWCGPECLRRPK